MLKTVEKCLEKFFPQVMEQEKENFLYAFFSFVYGIFPYAVVTKKQNRAMQKAEVNFKFHSIYELAYDCILKLLE